MSNLNHFESGLGRKILVLTKNVFNVSEKIPDQVLKSKIKSLALSIFNDFSLGFLKTDYLQAGQRKDAEELAKKIDNLNDTLYFVFSCGLVDEKVFRILSGAYTVFKSQIILDSFKELELRNLNNSERRRMAKSKINQPREMAGEKNKVLIERHRKILDFLKKNNKARIKNISLIFPDLSLRTIRNDLNYLCHIKKVKHRGWSSQSYYEII